MSALPSFANVQWIVAGGMLAATVVGVAGLAVRDRKLLESPVSWLTMAGFFGTSVAAGAAGWLGSAHADDPRALSWVFHLAPQMIGPAILSGIAHLTAGIAVRVAERSLPDGAERFRRLSRFVAAAPKAIAVGFGIGTLLLLVAPAPAVSVQWDLAPWAFFYRACVQLVPMLFATAICVLMLRLRRAFGQTQDASEAAALRKRVLANAVGAAGFALIYASHLAWPFVAVLWPDSRLGQDYRWYIEALQPPILMVVVLSYLALLLVRFGPNQTARFARYRALTERFGLQAEGFLDRFWKIRYKWSRAARLIELASEHLRLPHAERARAADAYKVVAVAKDAAAAPVRGRRCRWSRRAAAVIRSLAKGIDAAVSPAAARAAEVPEIPRVLSRDDVEDLCALHAKFLGEAAGSPRRVYSLRNRWAALIPEALRLTGASPLFDLDTYPRYLQLAVVVAADTGLLPPEQRRSVLDRSATPIDRRTLEAYEFARRVIERGGAP